jgi:hypothetical protein
MMTSNPRKLQVWIDARRRHHLSHAHVQMARELGLNPNKLGKIDNHAQQPWKQPLAQYIEQLYLKRFGRQQPDVVVPLEQRARRAQKKTRRKAVGTPAADDGHGAHGQAAT